jgi:ADP-heptose:LPS heptosyltransferase
VVIHPGAGSPRKRWPLEKFLALAERLAAGGRPPEFVTGPAEEDLAGRLARRGIAIHRPADASALLDRLRQAAACIGNDSGVSHLAAWIGRPTVAIFGPTDPVRWRPIGPAVAVVRPELDCRPCFETAGQNCDAAACLEAVSIEAVLAALARVCPAPRGPADGPQQGIKVWKSTASSGR